MGNAERESDKPEPASLTPLLAPILALQNLIQVFDDQGVIIGGVAASLLGTPRFTVDLDAVFLVSIRNVSDLLLEAERLGIEPRISDPIRFARRTRVLLLRHIPSGTDIDISLGSLPFEVEMVERSVVVEVSSLKMRLPTPEDLIILKAVANRPKDLEDIRAIAASHPDLDHERMRYWLEQFGAALDLPDFWDTIQNLLLSNENSNK
jgi:hypothetical protein